VSGIATLAQRLGHPFSDLSLLENALRHSSWAHEQEDTASNERLEFLGDAVLDVVVSELLYLAHPAWDEGTLTRTRAALVRRDALARLARCLDLGAHLTLGRTEAQSGGAEKASVLANAFEAVIGALYLDGGLAPVRALCERLYGDALHDDAEKDPKTLLNEWVHANIGNVTPRYETREDTGIEGDENRFTVAALVEDRARGTGVGRTKRAAEREAARAALRQAEASSE
jgi:ribonuclease-3